MIIFFRKIGRKQTPSNAFSKSALPSTSSVRRERPSPNKATPKLKSASRPQAPRTVGARVVKPEPAGNSRDNLPKSSSARPVMARRSLVQPKKPTQTPVQKVFFLSRSFLTYLFYSIQKNPVFFTSNSSVTKSESRVKFPLNSRRAAPSTVHRADMTKTNKKFSLDITTCPTSPDDMSLANVSEWQDGVSSSPENLLALETSLDASNLNLNRRLSAALEQITDDDDDNDTAFVSEDAPESAVVENLQLPAALRSPMAIAISRAAANSSLLSPPKSLRRTPAVTPAAKGVSGPANTPMFSKTPAQAPSNLVSEAASRIKTPANATGTPGNPSSSRSLRSSRRKSVPEPSLDETYEFIEDVEDEPQQEVATSEVQPTAPKSSKRKSAAVSFAEEKITGKSPRSSLSRSKLTPAAIAKKFRPSVGPSPFQKGSLRKKMLKKNFEMNKPSSSLTPDTCVPKRAKPVLKPGMSPDPVSMKKLFANKRKQQASPVLSPVKRIFHQAKGKKPEVEPIVSPKIMTTMFKDPKSAKKNAIESGKAGSLMKQVFAEPKPRKSAVMSPQAMKKMFKEPKEQPSSILSPKPMQRMFKEPKEQPSSIISPMPMQRMFNDETVAKKQQTLPNEVLSPIGMKKMFGQKAKQYQTPSNIMSPTVMNNVFDKVTPLRKASKTPGQTLVFTPAKTPVAPGSVKKTPGSAKKTPLAPTKATPIAPASAKKTPAKATPIAPGSVKKTPVPPSAAKKTPGSAKKTPLAPTKATPVAPGSTKKTPIAPASAKKTPGSNKKTPLAPVSVKKTPAKATPVAPTSAKKTPSLPVSTAAPVADVPVENVVAGNVAVKRKQSMSTILSPVPMQRLFGQKRNPKNNVSTPEIRPVLKNMFETKEAQSQETVEFSSPNALRRIFAIKKQKLGQSLENIALDNLFVDDEEDDSRKKTARFAEQLVEPTPDRVRATVQQVEPSPKPVRRRKAAAKQNEVAESENTEEPAPRRRRAVKKAVEPTEQIVEEPAPKRAGGRKKTVSEVEEEPAPKKRTGGRKKVEAVAEPVVEEEPEPTKVVSKRTGRGMKRTESVTEEEENVEPVKRTGRGKKAEAVPEPIVEKEEPQPAKKTVRGRKVAAVETQVEEKPKRGRKKAAVEPEVEEPETESVVEEEKPKRGRGGRAKKQVEEPVPEPKESPKKRTNKRTRQQEPEEEKPAPKKKQTKKQQQEIEEEVVEAKPAPKKRETKKKVEEPKPLPRKSTVRVTRAMKKDDEPAPKKRAARK